MTPARRQHDISQEQPRGFEIESVESVRARGCEGVHSTRLVAASRLVAGLDRMVTGVAGGDHKTAAELAVCDGEDHRDDFRMQSIDLRVR